MNVKIIKQLPDGQCQLCGAIDELRPYGPNYEMICFDCGAKDPETTTARFTEWMNDQTAVTVEGWPHDKQE